MSLRERQDAALARLRRLTVNRPIVIAHRGDSRACPENTLAAFAAAVRHGAPMIEFDVQTTADGVLVCLHDDGLDRTTDAGTAFGPGALARHLTLAGLQHLDAGSWKAEAFRGERIPTLQQALSAMLPQALPMIEHKRGTAAQYVDLLRRHSLTDQVLLQSFDWRFLADARALDPALLLGLLGPHHPGDRPDDHTHATASQLRASFLHWRDRALTKADVERIHAANLLCFSYTTDDELGWHGGKAMGVDGMCTNIPAAMLAWRRQLP